MKLILLIFMIFCHIVDDYYLQGWLAQAKQKDWWKKNAPDQLYKYDYIIALIMHGFSWSFVIMLPILAYFHYFTLDEYRLYLLLFHFNIIIHIIVDNMKANLKKINLIQDQIIHLCQIIITWIICVIIFN